MGEIDQICPVLLHLLYILFPFSFIFRGCWLKNFGVFDEFNFEAFPHWELCCGGHTGYLHVNLLESLLVFTLQVRPRCFPRCKWKCLCYWINTPNAIPLFECELIELGDKLIDIPAWVRTHRTHRRTHRHRYSTAKCSISGQTHRSCIREESINFLYFMSKRTRYRWSASVYSSKKKRNGRWLKVKDKCKNLRVVHTFNFDEWTYVYQLRILHS